MEYYYKPRGNSFVEKNFGCGVDVGKEAHPGLHITA